MDELSDGSVDAQSPAPVVQEKGPRCLPVATLDPAFDGQPKDGAEYLAMIQREAAALPFTTSIARENASGPSRHAKSESSSGYSEERMRVRHPALPKESWFVAFDGHFRSYRKSVRQALPELRSQATQSLKGSASSSRPIPNARAETEWLPFINGVKRKKMHKSALTDIVQSDKRAFRSVSDLDEEELFNSAPPELLLHTRSTIDSTNNGAAGKSDPPESDQSSAFVYEAAGPRHLPQEPSLLLLAMFDQERIYAALKALNGKMEANLSELEDSNSLIETQPGSAEGVFPASPTLPLNAHHARWLFALLLFLEDYLPPDELSELRRIAKTCLRICKWQATSGNVDQQGTGSTPEQEEMRVACWISIRAVATGWNQHDLPRDAEMMFAKLAQSSTTMKL